MEDLNRAIAILRQTASDLETKIETPTHRLPSTSSWTGPTSTSTTPSLTTPRNSGGTVAEVRRLFAPYGKRSTGTSKTKFITTMKWSHKFLCLSDPNQDSIPNKDIKRSLVEAGLGERRIIFAKTRDPQTLIDSLFNHFPKLEKGGGFELLRSVNKYGLDVIKPPTSGYTVEYLADSCSLGQSIVYIRPLQEALEMESNCDNYEPSEDCPLQACFICEMLIPVIRIKQHIAETHQGEDSLTTLKKRRQTAIPDYTIKTSTGDKSESESTSKQKVNCPLCNEEFTQDLILIHSATCSDITDIFNEEQELKVSETLADQLTEVNKKMINTQKKWKIAVLRNDFDRTSLDQLTEAALEDWQNKIFIKFINEEGVDFGGLTREFFSLLFKNEELLDLSENNFKLNPNHLENGVYTLFGRAVILAILYGHPGPRCFNQYIYNYILYETIPRFNDVQNIELCREDAKAALTDIENVTEENVNNIFMTHIDLLNLTGFTKQLTTSNTKEAATAIKGYFLFYRSMAPLLQLIEGLKLFGVLEILRRHPEDSILFFKQSPLISTEEIISFYLTSYSSDDALKIDEELVMYNFEKFLKRIERGRIVTPWIDFVKGTEDNVTLTTGHLLQSLIGCQFLTPTINKGLIIFDHASTDMTHINTCAPSITFCSIKHIKKYKIFEETLINITVSAYGFGMA